MYDMPKLVVVPDHLWEDFESTLKEVGIKLVSTDGTRSWRAEEVIE